MTAVCLALLAGPLIGCHSGASVSNKAAATKAPVPQRTTGVAPTKGKVKPTPRSVSPQPLTGLPEKSSGKAASRVAVAAVIRVGPGTPVPRGLQRADVVYAEYAGTPPLRLVALYQSRDHARVGPLGDVAPADAKLLPVTHAVLSAAGGPLRFRRVLHNTDIPLVLPRRYTRPFTDLGGAGSYVDTARARRASRRSAAPPPALFSYAGQGQGLATRPSRPAASLRVRVPGGPELSWRWDGRALQWRSQVGGRRVSAANVIVLETSYRQVATSKGGYEVSSADIFGEGKAHVFSVGLTSDGRWRRAGSPQLTNVFDKAGVPFRLSRGRTWVLFIPRDSSSMKVAS